MKTNLEITSWIFFNPLKYYAYRFRLRQGLSKEYCYKLIRGWDHKRVMAFLLYKYRG